MEDFCRRDCADLENFKNLSMFETKSCQINSKSSMQRLGFIYRKLTNFPQAIIFDSSNCITTKSFYKGVHRLLSTKIQFDHSHVTGEIYRSAHDF